ncbi:MAG: CBS and ACT domain-containing protein [Treponema sp.]|nr:CBS and ACT domain-containing protein [Treponema sp.]
MLVKDVMTKNPVTIQGDRPLPEAKDLMMKNDITKLPVLDKAGGLIGIITSNDIKNSGPSDATTLDMFELSYLLNKMTVNKVMVSPVVTVSENETVEEAARLMLDYDIGSLVVKRDDLVVGIVTESDLFKAFISMFGTRHAGVRATFVMGDKPGALSEFAKTLAERNGNIVSLVTADVEDAGKRKVTLRASGIEMDDLKSIISSAGASLEDIRRV